MSISTPTIADILKVSQLENIELMATTQSTAVQTRTQTLTEKKLPLPNSAIHDEQWIDLLVSGLKTTTELSAKTLQYYKIIRNGTFQNMVKAKMYSWKNEEDYRSLFRFLQELALHCAFDIAREEFPDFFHPGSYPVTESETGPKARADISSVVYLEHMATEGLYLSATELKTILTLPRASLSTAKALSQPRLRWTKPKALYNHRIGAEREKTSVNEKAAIDLLWQNYSQLVLRSVAEEGSDFIVAPLYGIVGNFNEMIIVKRPTKPSEQNTTVVLSGPHKPKELLPRMVAIYADQLRKICSTDVKKLVSWKARADDDEDADNDHQEPPNKRTKTETKGQTKPSKSTRKSPRNFSSKKSESAKTGKGKRKYVQAILSSATWPVGTRFQSVSYITLYASFPVFFNKAVTQISYTWEFRLGGNPFIVNNTPTVLPSWPDSPSVVHKFSTLKNGDSPCIKLTSILGEGVTGTTFGAVVANGLGSKLVWKEMASDDEAARKYAVNEIRMYEGPLSQLQGTVVPIFYGAYHDEGRSSIGLLMEHVGQGLKDASWDSVSPEIRERAHDLHVLLHNAGIEHGDFFPRNVCVKKDGQVRIIDFSHSTMKL